MTNQYEPSRKTDRWANQRQRDWKHGRREDRDHSRAGGLRVLNYRNPNWDLLYPAFETNDVGVVLDTVLALSQGRMH